MKPAPANAIVLLRVGGIVDRFRDALQERVERVLFEHAPASLLQHASTMQGRSCIIVLDALDPDGIDFPLLRELRSVNPAASTIVFVHHADADEVVDAMRLGVIDILHGTPTGSRFRTALERAVGAMTDAPVEPGTGCSLREAMEGPERRFILAALESNHWNRQATARQLRIDRTTLYKKMKQLGIAA